MVVVFQKSISDLWVCVSSEKSNNSQYLSFLILLLTSFLCADFVLIF